MQPDLLSLILILCFWILVIYFIQSLFSKKLIKINPKNLFAYCGALAIIGPIGEISINTVYTYALGTPLWIYQLFPIHHGYTSLFSFFIWPAYGFHVYLLHEKLNSYNFKNKDIVLATFVAFDAMILEVLLNISSILLFGKYVFFYFPPDIYHLTTLVVIPFYFLGGLVIVKTLKRFLKDPIFFGVMSFLISAVVVFLN